MNPDKSEAYGSQKQTLLYIFYYYCESLSFGGVGDVTRNLSDFIGLGKKKKIPLFSVGCLSPVQGKLQDGGESTN